jgi:hypothetical protein
MRLGTGAIVLFVGLASSARAAQADFTVTDYCDLTLKASQVAELEWKDRILLAKSHQGTSKSLSIKLQALETQHSQLRNQLYARYGTTFQDFLRYGASHQSAIKLHLEQNPSVRSALEDASSRVQSLRQQMESAMAARQGKEVRK